MVVYVQDKQGRALMPTARLGMVRRWLKSGRAEVVRREPFTIRLVDVEDGYTQPLSAGIDQGTAHVGVSVVSETEEVLSAEVELRTDVSKLLTERRTYRRSRRSRKIRHRAPRFLNRKHKDRLPPSVRAKVEESVRVVALLQSLLPITDWTIELGNFDTHKLSNPAVEGADYQHGPQETFFNTREYVLWRDQHTCQACHGASQDLVLQVHHINPRKAVGSDRPDNLITLCKTCHTAHHHDQPLKLPVPRSWRDPAQFNILKHAILHELAELAPHVTFGYLTKSRRIALGLPKSHRHDAFVIAGGTRHQRAAGFYRAVFARRQNRKLFKGAHSHIRNTIPSAFGLKRGDCIRLADGRQGFIFGLRSSGYFDVRRLDGSVLHHSAKHSTLRRLQVAHTLRIERYLSEGDKAHSSPA